MSDLPNLTLREYFHLTALTNYWMQPCMFAYLFYVS